MAIKKEKQTEETIETKDISDEIYRLYRFSDGGNVTIHNPVSLQDHGNRHVITDDKGNVHEVIGPWIHIKYRKWSGEKEKKVLMEDE